MEPIRSNLNVSIEKELERAEEAHLQTCPEADFSVRIAAFLVDCILAYLAISGLKNLSQAMSVFLSHGPSSSWGGYVGETLIVWLSQHSAQISAAFEITSKVTFVFIYFITSTAISGGTPGKLLLGLRVLDSETGKKISSAKTLTRYVLAITFGFGSMGLIYVSGLLSTNKRALHDRIVRTAVKKVHGAR